MHIAQLSILRKPGGTCMFAQGLDTSKSKIRKGHIVLSKNLTNEGPKYTRPLNPRGSTSTLSFRVFRPSGHCVWECDLIREKSWGT